MSKARTSGRDRGVLTVVLGVALALRLWGTTYGLPAVYNPDEVAIMNRTLALWPNGWDPQNYLYPSLYFYVLFVWEGLWFAVGRLAGWYTSLTEFEKSYFIDPTAIYVAGRTLTALFGTATVWATWRLATTLFGRAAGLTASTLLAVAPLAVRDAHYVKHDVPVTFLLVMAHLLAAKASLSDRTTDLRVWGLTGVAAGLALSTHYYAVFVVIPIAIVAASGDITSTWRRWWRVGLGTTLAFMATSPFVVLNAGVAWRDITANRSIVVDRVTESTGLFGSMGYYVSHLAQDAFGPVGILLLLMGVIGLAGTTRTRLVLVLAFPIVFVVFISNTFPASRYLNAVLPFVATAAGAGAARLAHTFRSRAVAWIPTVTVALVASVGAWASVTINRFFLATDTRTLAGQWIEATWPSGTSTLVQPYSVPLRQSRAGLDEALTHHLGTPTAASVRFRRQRELEPYPEPAYRTIFLGAGGLDVDKIYLDPAAIDRANSLEPVRALGVTHVILKQYNVRDPAMASLERALRREGRLEASWSPYRPGTTDDVRAAVAPFLHNTDVRMHPDLERPGPIVEIWSLER